MIGGTQLIPRIGYCHVREQRNLAMYTPKYWSI